MKKNITYLLGLVSSAAMVSCYPPPPPPQPNTGPVVVEDNPEVDPTNDGLSEADRAELDALQGEAGIGDGTRSTNPGTNDGRPPVISDGGNTGNTGATGGSKPADPPRNEPTSYPFARPVPNNPGFVFNPYTQAKVDVRGLPSGTLVTDPRNETQKFYVP